MLKRRARANAGAGADGAVGGTTPLGAHLNMSSVLVCSIGSDRREPEGGAAIPIKP